MTVRATMLAQLGVGPVWRLREVAAEAAPTAISAPELRERPAPPASPVPESVAPPPTGVTRAPPVAEEPRAALLQDWESLAETVATCRLCVLCQRRKQAVLGVGDRQADWLFVGEGPGAEEDERGEPFVGQAGKLLDAMLLSIGLQRGQGVYIGNAVKCRPPNNRTPEPDEVAACFPYLAAQIELIRPRVIVALGRPAAQALLAEDVRIGAARGKVFKYREIPVIVTYHPAYLLRNLDDKRKAWEDLCFARSLMQSLGR